MRLHGEFGAWLARDRRLVNRWLSGSLRLGPSVPRALAQAMRYATLGGGKRLRAIAVLESFRAAGGRRLQYIAPFCSGIEMIHAFSLVHDDLPSMDDDDLRRGRPSLHRRFGEATAILAADALFALAFETLARSRAPADRRLRAIELLARAVGPRGMAAGQVLDIQAVPSGAALALERLQRLKTGELFAAAFQIGAIIAGVADSTAHALRRAGLLVGSVFQITDDLLDVAEGSESQRLTMPSRHGVDQSKRVARLRAGRAVKMLKRLGSRYELLAALPGTILGRTD